MEKQFPIDHKVFHKDANRLLSCGEEKLPGSKKVHRELGGQEDPRDPGPRLILSGLPGPANLLVSAPIPHAHAGFAASYF